MSPRKVSFREQAFDTMGSHLAKEEEMMNDIRYELIVFWSAEDQSFVVQVPELPGCAADGASYQEAVANAEVVIREWIETARELGQPVPEPRGRLIFA